MYIRVCAWLISALLCALLWSCQGSGQGTAEFSLSEGAGKAQNFQGESAPEVPLLPAPADLLAASRDRGASYVPADLTKEAEDFNPLLPNQNVSAATPGPNLVMSPNWLPGSPASGLAYVTLQYDIDDYDLNNLVHLEWGGNIPDRESIWLALADWDRNRWRWFAAGDMLSQISVPALNSYFTPQGDLLLVVLLTGSDETLLDSVRVGTPRPLVEVEVTGPASAFGELTTSFDASGSQSFGGDLTYEWDFEGDGVYDESTGSDATNEFSFSEAGSYNVTVRATDTLTLLRGVGSTVVSVGGPWVHSLGGAMDEVVTDLQSAPDGTIWACGNVLNGSHYRDIFLLQYAADGQLLQEKYWSHTEEPGGNSCLVREMEIAPDGTVCLLGTLQTAGNYETMLQGWGSDGELDWIRVCDDDAFEFSQLRYANDRLIPLGRRLQSGSYRGIYCTFFTNGSLQHAYSTNDPAVFNDVLYRHGFLVGESGLYFCGHTGEIATLDQDLLVFQRVPTELFGTAYTWGQSGLSEVGQSIALRGILSDETVVVGTQFTDSSVFQAGMVRFGTDAAEAHGPSGLALRVVDLAATPQSLLLVGTLDNSGALLQQYDNNCAFSNSLSYSPGANCQVRAADGYSVSGLVIGGDIDVAGGSFGSAPTDSGSGYSNAWSEGVQVSMSAISNPWLTATIENVASVPPGTADSGGGGADAWVCLSDQPLE